MVGQSGEIYPYFIKYVREVICYLYSSKGVRPEKEQNWFYCIGRLDIMQEQKNREKFL